MNDIMHFDVFAMVEPKTAADRHAILRELNAELDILLDHFTSITADCSEDADQCA